MTAPTQSDAVWELPIAQMTAGHLTDRRVFVATGNVVAYAEMTANHTNAATSQGAAVPFLSAPVLAFEPVPHLFTFYAPFVQPAAGESLYVHLFDTGTNIGRMAHVTSAAQIIRAPVFAQRWLTPPAGTHTYTLRSYGSVTGGSVGAGAGGLDPALMPAFFRITR